MSETPKEPESYVDVAPTFRVVETHQVFGAPRSRHWLTPEQCEKIIALWDEDMAEQSTYAGADVIPNYREGKIQWLTPWQHKDLFTKLYAVLRDANARHYGVDVDGMVDYLQLTRYEEGDHYDWHMDCANARFRHRKLSFSLQLSSPEDYEGGNLEFFPSDTPAVRDQGSMTVFPSFLMHRVTPITRGTRWALVGWASGGAWR